MNHKRGRVLTGIVILVFCLQFLATIGIVTVLIRSWDRIAYTAESGDEALLPFQEAETGKYVMYIGTNDKDTYTQLIPLEEAKAIVNEICSRYVSGYTVQTAEGGWVDETGTLTQEQTLVYSFDAVEEADMLAIMDEVLVALNQNSILLEKQGLTYCYYSGGGQGE